VRNSLQYTHTSSRMGKKDLLDLMSGLSRTDCLHTVSQEGNVPCCSFSKSSWCFTNFACTGVQTAWYQKDVALQSVLSEAEDLALSLSKYSMLASLESLLVLSALFASTCSQIDVVLNIFKYC